MIKKDIQLNVDVLDLEILYENNYIYFCMVLFNLQNARIFRICESQIRFCKIV